MEHKLGGMFGVRAGGVVEVREVARDLLRGEVVGMDPVQEFGQDGPGVGYGYSVLQPLPVSVV